MADLYPYDPYRERVCIIVEKVFFSCQQRECFPNFPIDLPNCGGPFTFVDMTFQNGVILPESIVITPIPSRPNFARAQFTVRICFTATVRNAAGQLLTVSGCLPDIFKDIVIYYPPTRPEFDFNLRVETRSELLVPAIISGDDLIVTVGAFVITKLTGFVQLAIDAFGYCPEPPYSEEFPTEEPCIDFLNPNLTPFPTDFFPPQLPCPVPGPMYVNLT
ncbi:MAG TPA: hypothetical protein GX523_10440 [Desulfitobacterium dehalogenans]|uniref:DUF3794 domain-containing protein n=1 Tax=Desulfitobacterium dehalogenans TaxID=36854 RepID=A0A7C7DA23_9FIRM|nr:hypothetical protein [Desulfitobacterium dehalogenans]